MNSIAYLSQLNKINAVIECKEAEIENLYEISTSITAAIKDDCVQKSGTSDKVGDCVAKIADLQNEIQLEIEKYLITRSEILGTISKLESRETKLLYKRYFEAKTWGQIADEMHYSRQTINLIHKKALQNLQKII